MSCTINGASGATVRGAGWWNRTPVTFELNVLDDEPPSLGGVGDAYGLVIHAGTDLVFFLPATSPTYGDIVVSDGH